MLAVLLGVFAALCWSLHDLIARVYAPRLGAFHMGLAVIIVGGILLAPLALNDPRFANLGREGLILSAMLGIAYAGGLGGLFKALSLGPISFVGPVTATYPALVILWNITQGEWPSPLQWLSIAAALVGAVVVSRSGHHDGGLNAVARKHLVPLFLACAVAMIFWAAAIVLGQKAGAIAGEYTATFISRLVATMMLLPLVWGEPRQDAFQRSHLKGIIAMGLLDVVGQVAVNMTGTMQGHAYTAIGIASYGAISALLAAIFLSERVSPGQWIGIAMIVVGVAGVTAG